MYTRSFDGHCFFLCSLLSLFSNSVYITHTSLPVFYKGNVTCHLTNAITCNIVNKFRYLKMLCLYRLGQNYLHLTFKPYLSSETYSRQYEKLPSIVVHACKILQKKMYLLKMSGPQIWLCLFTFRPIASKQLNGLTTIHTLS